jgi:D-alanyl-D-alanine carboxypeptidase
MSGSIERGSGGEGGIRTHETLARPTVFKTVAFNHSATSPAGRRIAAPPSSPVSARSANPRYARPAVTIRMLPRTLTAVIAVALLASSLTVPAAAAPPPVEPALAAKLQARLNQWRVSHHAPGVAAAIRLPDGSRWMGTSGRAIRGVNGRDVEVYTPFAAASLTKTFMAALILQLKEERKLWLTSPISTWLPDYPRGQRITIRMLLSHRSGIADYFANPAYERKVFGRPRHKWTTGEILALTPRPVCAPGRCYRYSNTNYVLLAEIVRKVTGHSAAQEIRRRFLDPLGLTDTFFQGQEKIKRVPAEGYWWTGGGYKRFADGTRMRPNTSAATVADAAGALVSSVRDISDWQDALFDGRVLKPRSMQQMQALNPRSGYGLGMRRAWLDGKPGLGHGGSLRGFVAVMYRLPEDDLDVTVLTNLGRTSLQGLADALTETTLDYLEPEPTPPPAPMPPPTPSPTETPIAAP